MSTDSDTDDYGVLLYYKYTQIDDLYSLSSFYHSNCSSLSILGRVRLSPHGVNVTVGGKLSSLEKHIAALKEHAVFEGTDFKLASCEHPLNDKVAAECGFTSLSIRIVKELVTFSPYSLLKLPDVSNAGRHLSALEFHSVLNSAGKVMGNKRLSVGKGFVLLDARNLYETRIGRFETPAVETLDPQIRQYSDLPSWIDDHSEQLRGKHILMYCTGGIRCEMASAYVKTKGAGFENVFQLFGGIQRYLEQFPDGGFFKGKNFVFDHRISVSSSDTNILGVCLLCGLSFDDYSSRCRCSCCRMLVLVCNGCQKEDSIYVCELCQKYGRAADSVPSIESGKPREMIEQVGCKAVASEPKLSAQLHQGQGVGPSKKLRILCLHGFRQNASGFKGRTASLAKKLKNIAELVFIDAPHELPFICQPHVEEPECKNASSQQRLPPPESKRKFAWLVAPDSGGNETDWQISTGPFDPLQYQHQTEGFDTSLAYLKTGFLEKGPFDGILGFSQGAAMTASVCAAKEMLKGEIDFRFVVLCSGFAVQSMVSQSKAAFINCPSLHIFGRVSGMDRQIANQASRDLASLFDDNCSVIVEHDCGHIIPTRPPYIDEIKGFLQRFL